MNYIKVIAVSALLLGVVSVCDALTQISTLQTDKALYAPGGTVTIDVTFSTSVSSAKLVLEYYHLGTVVARDTVQSVSGTTRQVTWVTPADDFTGYLLTVTLSEGGTPSDTNNIAIDVSSSWKKFPRYGFLSTFPTMTQSATDAVVDNLNRHHINGIQFYDWQWKHHIPLKGEVGNVATSWPNIANETEYLATLNFYLAACSTHGMKRMAYNLLYGAYADAASDGVSDAWRIFTDRHNAMPDYHDLPSNWASDIYLIDHSNSLWVNYLNAQMKKVFQALSFDGWHIDQLGSRGTRYNYSGTEIDMPGAFHPFIDSAKSALGVPLVCNAVSNYAQSSIAQTDVDFLYSEVWAPDTTYSQLANVISANNGFSSNTKNTVLAAYVNKAKSSSIGIFNTPSVMFTNAVIFASGGSHLELGEHMLGNEYFPNDNLSMSTELQANLMRYYDYLTAYENILRDDVQTSSATVTAEGYTVSMGSPVSGQLCVIPRTKDNMVVLHILNFTQAATMNWRDDAGIQVEPDLRQNVKLILPFSKTIKNIWYVSPDNLLLTPQSISYTVIDSTVTMTLPRLKYLSTIVVEWSSASYSQTYYIAGSFQSPTAWVTATTLMYDDGTNGDAVSGDSIYSRAYVVATAGLHEWKATTGHADWIPAWPTTTSGNNAWFTTTTTNQTVLFTLNTKTLSDVFYPKTKIVQTNETMPATIVAIGDWQSNAGEAGNWINASTKTVMHDDGADGDGTAGDGIYAYHTNTLPAGAWQWRPVKSGSWYGWGIEGRCMNGTNQSFTTTTANQDVYLYFNSNTGRIGMSLGSPLPVELTSFTASAGSGQVTLNWTTATEVNNYGFEVEKKTTADNWQKIGFVEGSGTTNAPKQYLFVDKSTLGGAASYRLKQIDRDGTYEYSSIVETTVGMTAQDYQLSQNYPNPFNPSTTFSFAMKNAEHASVNVFNTLGQNVATLFDAVAQPNHLYALTFDAKNLPSGMYFYTLRSNSRNEMKKMMLLK